MENFKSNSFAEIQQFSTNSTIARKSGSFVQIDEQIWMFYTNSTVLHKSKNAHKPSSHADQMFIQNPTYFMNTDGWIMTQIDCF